MGVAPPGPRCAAGKVIPIGSGNVVRYSNGELMLTDQDLDSEGFGQSWGHTRTYSNRLSSNPSNEGVNGAGWFIKECPRLANLNPAFGNPNQATIIVLGDVGQAVWFDYSSGSYQGRFFLTDTLVHSGDEFIYVDSHGRQFKFYDFTVTPTALQGQFKSFVNPYGQETTAVYGANNQIASFTREPASGSGSGSGIPRSSAFDYVYYSSGENAGRLQSVTQMVGTANVRRAQYTYHGSGSRHGSLGDLQLVKVQQFNVSHWDDLGTTYYRYYKAGDPR